MASPQWENGFTKIANEIVEALVKVRLPPSEKDIVLFIIRKTYGYQKKEDRISLTQFELGTGLSRPTVVKALKNLISRNMVVKAGLLIKFNKDYEKWVVNAGLLVKSQHEFGKGGFTKTSKGGLTHKRKKEMTKEIPEQSSEDISFIIKQFESINPSSKNFYGRPPQRKACLFLIETYGFDRVVLVVQKTLPKTNGMQFFPTITTPIQLQDKWSMLESAIKRYQSENKKLKSSVAF